MLFTFQGRPAFVQLPHQVLRGGRYASSFELTSVETTNMGSLYQLEYALSLREAGNEKALIDEVRCLNGNLKVVLGLVPANREVL